VGRHHELDAQVVENRPEFLGIDARRGHAAAEILERPGGGGPSPGRALCRRPDLLELLDEVHQLEVHGEAADQVGKDREGVLGDLSAHAALDSGPRPGAQIPELPAHRLDPVEDRPALLILDHGAEDAPEQLHLAPDGGVNRAGPGCAGAPGRGRGTTG
jgi:hypothetical protein